MFKKLPKPEHGFTMVEVLIAILIATIFVTVSLQMMVVAAIFKARAQEYAESTTWIQEDLENVKFQGSQIGLKEVEGMTAASDLITITNHEFVSGETVIFVGDGTIAKGLSKNKTYYVRDVTSNTFKVANASGGTAIDLTSDSTGSLASVATTRCTATITNGYADGLRDLINNTPNLSSLSFPKNSSLTNKPFTLTRKADLDPNDSKVLQVSYTVSSDDSGKTVASFYTEVIPNAALQCPN